MKKFMKFFTFGFYWTRNNALRSPTGSVIYFHETHSIGPDFCITLDSLWMPLDADAGFWLMMTLASESETIEAPHSSQVSTGENEPTDWREFFCLATCCEFLMIARPRNDWVVVCCFSFQLCFASQFRRLKTANLWLYQDRRSIWMSLSLCDVTQCSAEPQR